MQTANSVLNPPTSVDTNASRSFFAKAEADLAGIRSGILIFLQDQNSRGDLDAPVRDLNALKRGARAIGLTDIEALFTDCERVLTDILENPNAASERDTRRALDILAQIEASLVKIPLRDDELFPDVSDFVDESFANLTNGNRNEPIQPESESQAGFEIDEETLEIFRSEASGLLETISANLEALTAHPHDQDALWNIRRCAHTFKGAAGIVGITEASELAHRVEDLLDQLAENRDEIDEPVIELLTVSARCLTSMTIGNDASERSRNLASIYSDFDRVIAENSRRVTRSSPASSRCPDAAINDNAPVCDTVKPPPAPIVRVSLDRLDELLKITRNLAINRSVIAQRFGEFSAFAGGDKISTDVYEKLGSLIETQHRLTFEMQDKLRRIRMVRFGMLTTRLNRAVHVTCQEENKKAAVVVQLNCNCS